MLRFLLNLLKSPVKFYNSIFNFALLRLTNSNYSSFPIIVGKLVRRGKGKLIIGNHVKINSETYINPVGLGSKTMFYVGPEGQIKIGNHVGISSSLFFANESIVIEDYAMIGGGCQILDNDFHSLYSKDRPTQGLNVKSAPIKIEEHAFIGASSIIIKGITIGARSIVAAGSVVTKSIPPNEIWGGNPATFIKKNRLELQESNSFSYEK